MRLKLKEDWLSYFLSGVFAGIVISLLIIMAWFPAYVSFSTGAIFEIIVAAVLSVIMFLIASARKTKSAETK